MRKSAHRLPALYSNQEAPTAGVPSNALFKAIPGSTILDRRACRGAAVQPKKCDATLGGRRVVLAISVGYRHAIGMSLAMALVDAGASRHQIMLRDLLLAKNETRLRLFVAVRFRRNRDAWPDPGGRCFRCVVPDSKTC